MTETTEKAAPLAPEQRCKHLHAYAARMVRAFRAMDAPETPDAVSKGRRTLPMMERLRPRSGVN